GPDPAIAADQVQVVGSLHQELAHPGVVVVRSGQVTVGALLGFASAAAANCVRDIGAERGAAVAVGGESLLLNINRFAVVVVRADVDGTRRSRGANAVARHVAIP